MKERSELFRTDMGVWVIDPIFVLEIPFMKPEEAELMKKVVTNKQRWAERLGTNEFGGLSTLIQVDDEPIRTGGMVIDNASVTLVGTLENIGDILWRVEEIQERKKQRENR